MSPSRVYPRDKWTLRERWLIPQSRGAGILAGLVYPSPYFVGMSNLGFHVIYRLLSGRASTRVERIFYPGPRERPVRSVESQRPAGDFDVLAFSCAFEPDYLNLIRILLQSGIEPLRRDRPESDPLLIAGGIAATSNPATMAEVIDVFLLGEGEEILDEAWDVLEEQRQGQWSKEDILSRLAQIPGAYVPAVHGLEPEQDFTKRTLRDISDYPTGSAILTPDTELSNMFLIEAARGCVRGCDFCLIGHFMSKLKIRQLEAMIEQIEQVRPHLSRVGLVASEIACHPGIAELCEYLLSNDLEISTSSVEIDRLSPELINLLARGGQKTMTIAPESGDERLRFGLHKKISDERIFEIAHLAGRAGMERLKMYIIIGMPHSGEEEIESLIPFLEKVQDYFTSSSGRGAGREVSASINPFIPKPHTPWAAEPMAPENEFKRRIMEVRKRAGRLKGIRITSWSPTVAALDAALSLSDSTVGPLLVKFIREGQSPRQLIRSLLKEGSVNPYHRRSVDPKTLWKSIKPYDNFRVNQ